MAVFETTYSSDRYGAVFVGNRGTHVEFVHCDFAGNEARQRYHKSAPLLGSFDFGAGRGGGVALSDSASATFRDCVFIGNVANEASAAVHVDSGAVADIRRCVSSMNDMDVLWDGGPPSPEIAMGTVSVVGASALVANCTFVHNSRGPSARIVAHSDVAVASCLFAGWESVFADTSSAAEVQYSLFSSPYSIDRHPSETNILALPLFADSANGDYHLTHGSPARNSGDPESPLDPDGSRADIGAYWYPTGVGIEPAHPRRLRLHPNAPNPFNPVTTIRFETPYAGDVRLMVYNVSGQIVRAPVDGHRDVGMHTVSWDGLDAGGRRVASGVYVYRLDAAGLATTRRMTLLR